LVAGVAFGIVYLCTLGLRLGINSTASAQPRTVSDLAGPAFEETIAFFEDAFAGDLGYSYYGVSQRTRLPTLEVLAETYTQSAKLLAVSIGIAALIGVLAGGLAAARSYSPAALSTLTLTVIGVSIPSFFLALLFQVADIRFYERTGVGLFPVFGISIHRTSALLPQVIAPAVVLAARPLAQITRITFVTLSDILRQDYVRTARSKGLTSRTVFFRHALRNAGVSVLTAVVVSLRFSLGSLPVVESFFAWPGIGFAMLNGILARDARTVSAMALSLGATFLVLNLVLEFLYRLIDPRRRTAQNGGDA
jgi:peptide/nickel transport system permease protein